MQASGETSNSFERSLGLWRETPDAPDRSQVGMGQRSPGQTLAKEFLL